jgi:leader peptidase (prepilin peptidase)/N-methyltransferase
VETWIGAALAGVVGLAIGSFLNVCIYRMPRGMSIIRPRSHCFFCNTELTAADLVPVVSWFLLQGRCRSCGVRISGRYALVELATGILVAGFFWRYGPSVDFFANALFACILIPIFLIDLEHLIIPTPLNVAGMLVGLGADFARWRTGQYLPVTWNLPGTPWLLHLPPSLVGMLLGGGLFLGVVGLGSWLFRREAMGGGDVRFAAAAGALFGPTYAFLTFFLLSIFLGAAVGLLLIALRLRSRWDYIPFGPFMVLSALVLMWGGQPLVALVRQRFGG